VIAALLELEDLSFSHRLPADPVGWLRSRMNGGITVEVSGMRKIEDGESWVEWGADVLGLTTKTEVACPKCGGSGVLNGAPSPTKKAVLQAALSLNGSYHPTPTQSIRGLSNPSLGQLRSLTVRLGGGLDDAAAFCDRLASLITKDLPG
jgi:hypothetical protein